MFLFGPDVRRDPYSIKTQVASTAFAFAMETRIWWPVVDNTADVRQVMASLSTVSGWELRLAVDQEGGNIVEPAQAHAVVLVTGLKALPTDLK